MIASARKARVALVVPGFADGGGVPVVAAFLYRVLNASGQYQAEVVSLATSAGDANSVRLLAPRSWAAAPRITAGTWQGVPYRHVGARFTELEFQRCRHRQALTRLAREYDLIQVVAGTPFWALAVRGCRRPVCLQVATLTHVERQTRLRGRGAKCLWRRAMTTIMTRLDQQALHGVDTVLVENHWMEAYLRRRIDPARLVFAPPGVDTAFFRPAAYRPEGYLLAVGRWNDPRKNVRLLFAAYAALCRERPETPELVLAGKRPRPEDWEHAVRLGIAERIRCYEGVSPEELRALYQGAGLFVLSSDEEGLGLVILEAMASGLPVVSTACGGPQTAVVEGVTGLLTPVGDAGALASAMGELWADPGRRRQMGAAGRQVAESRFSLAAAGGVFLARYGALLS